MQLYRKFWKNTQKMQSAPRHISKQVGKKTNTLRILYFYHKLVICDDGVTPPSGSVVISCCCERTTAGSPANHWHLAWLMMGQQRLVGAQTRPSEWHHRREPGVKQSLWRQWQQKAKWASCRNLNLGYAPPTIPWWEDTKWANNKCVLTSEQHERLNEKVMFSTWVVWTLNIDSS